jgi:hypothetical protein
MKVDKHVLISVALSVGFLAVPLLGNGCFFITPSQCTDENDTRLQSGEFEDNGGGGYHLRDMPKFPHREIEDREMTIDREEGVVTVSYDDSNGDYIEETWAIVDTKIANSADSSFVRFSRDAGMGDAFSGDGSDGAGD